jgi:hypothetical protein
MTSRLCCSARPRLWGNVGVGHGSLQHASPSALRCCCREARRGKLVWSWNTSIAMRSRTVLGQDTPPPKSLDIAPLRVGVCLGPRLRQGKRWRGCGSFIVRRLKRGICMLAADWRSSLPKCWLRWRNRRSGRAFFPHHQGSCCSGTLPSLPGGRVGIWRAFETSLHPSSIAGVDGSRGSTVCGKPAFTMGRPLCRQSF